MRHIISFFRRFDFSLGSNQNSSARFLPSASKSFSILISRKLCQNSPVSSLTKNLQQLAQFFSHRSSKKSVLLQEYRVTMVLPIYETPEDVSKTSDGLSVSQSITGEDESDAASSTKNRVEKEMQNSIAKKEEEMIFFVRLLVFLAIICSAVAVSVAVYFFAASSDTSLFEYEVSKFRRMTLGNDSLQHLLSYRLRLLCDIAVRWIRERYSSSRGMGSKGKNMSSHRLRCSHETAQRLTIDDFCLGLAVQHGAASATERDNYLDCHYHGTELPLRDAAAL